MYLFIYCEKKSNVFTNEDSSKKLHEWWNEKMATRAAGHKRRIATLIIYTMWNLWKERNRIIFENKTMQPWQLVQQIKEEMKLREMVFERHIYT